MQENKKVTVDGLSKKIIFILIILLLINPIVLYLLGGNILISVLAPILLIILMVIFRSNKNLSSLSLIFFNLILIASIFIHSEVIFTFKFKEYIIEDLYVVKKNYYFNRPYLDKTFQDKEFLVQYKTNSQGFRIGSEDDPEVKVDQADWLFIGDSYTQGAQVQFEELFTSKLFDDFPNKIIVNAGISGLGIADEYYYYIKEGKKLNASKVFLQICNFNDFMNVGKRNSGFSDYLMHHSNFARFILYRFKYANPEELPLGRWTEPFSPDEKSNADFNIFYQEKSEQKMKDLANFEIYLKKFADAVKENGAELIIIQIPTKEQVYFKYLNEVIDNFNIDVSKLDMNFPNIFLGDLCKSHQIKHLDLMDDFTDSQQELFFEFDEHLNIWGHQQISNSLNRLLSTEKNKDNFNATLLSELNVGDRYPNFAANNNNLITFQSLRDGNMEIFIADSLLKKPKRLTWNNIDESHPWISSGGTKLIFTEGDQYENNTKIVIMDINGNNRKYITDQRNTFGAIPSFDSSDNCITYPEWTKDEKTGYLSNPYIIVYNQTTGNKSYITSDDYESWRPIFSPDNKKIFYISKEKENQFDIYEYNLFDGSKRNLTNSSYEEWDHAISRDGKKMVYAAKKDDNWDLFLMHLDTEKVERLTESRGNEWDPTFSSCGKYIYYSATYGLKNGIFRMPIH